MKWLKRKLAKWTEEGNYQNSYNNSRAELRELSVSDIYAVSGSNGSTRSPGTNSINFQIYPANGGHVAEITFIDNNVVHLGNSTTNKSLHIIPNSDDLGESISKIITYEMLKR